MILFNIYSHVCRFTLNFESDAGWLNKINDMLNWTQRDDGWLTKAITKVTAWDNFFVMFIILLMLAFIQRRTTLFFCSSSHWIPQVVDSTITCTIWYSHIRGCSSVSRTSRANSTQLSVPHSPDEIEVHQFVVLELEDCCVGGSRVKSCTKYENT